MPKNCFENVHSNYFKWWQSWYIYVNFDISLKKQTILYRIIFGLTIFHTKFLETIFNN